VSGGSIARG
jgi:hypothetical protein